MRVELVDEVGVLEGEKWPRLEEFLKGGILDSSGHDRLKIEAYFGGLASYVWDCFCRLARPFLDSREGLDGGLVELVFVGTDSIKALNSDYLGRDFATDVLSFPLEDAPSLPDLEFGDIENLALPFLDLESISLQAPSLESKRLLGSVVINLDLALEQASGLGHHFYTEISLLFIHGCLHLLGFDHESDKGQHALLEARIAAALGLPTSLAHRANSP